MISDAQDGASESWDGLLPSARVCRPVLAALLAWLIWVPGAAAEPLAAGPFVPDSDSQILERLPEARAGQGRTLHARLAADPRNLDLAVEVASADLARARAAGDPRYLGRAEAALAPWPASSAAPPQTLLLRAEILQSNHDFTGSLALLARVLRAQPGNAQAWLVRAAVHQAQADYARAEADCGQFAGLQIGLAPDVCTASVMALTGRAALALRAVTLSLAVNAAEAARAPGVAMWALTLAAETADRLDDPSAEARFGRAMALDPSDPYLLGAWSDWLLDHGRPGEVVALLAGQTRIDPLLLRLYLAEQALGAAAAPGHAADLAARFEASRLRGDSVHRREQARFELAQLHPAEALRLATANWAVQREPADARVLLEAAIASGEPVAAAPALAWLRGNAVDDRRLWALAARLQAPKS